MPIRLIVMRHAKSSWASGAQSDHDRPLNNRGQRDAPRVGARLVELGWQPDFVLSSDARRTRETFVGLSESFEGDVPVEFLDEFYLAGVKSVKKSLPKIDNQYRTVLLLGHNPGWGHVVEWLSGQPVEMKTACAALHESTTELWRDSCPSETEWRLEEFIRPREL